MPAPSALADARGYERDRSFTVEQFEDLVHSALDAQSLPDSALSFSFGGNIYPPSPHSPHSSRAKNASKRKTGTFSRIRGAFTRKPDLTDASSIVPPETRRLASSSVPTLSLLRSKTAPTASSYISLDLQRSHYNAPSSPTLATEPSSFPFLENSFPPYELHNGTRNCSNSPSLNIPFREKSSSSARSFLGLKPLTIPKLTKTPSGGPFSTGSLPTPPDSDTIRGPSPAATDDFINIESDGMYSFFDDSGFEDLYTPNVTRKKSKASFRSLFSSAASESNAASNHSGSKREKALPPTPALDKLTSTMRRRKSSKTEAQALSQRNSVVDDRRSSLFYSPPCSEQSTLENRSKHGQLDSKPSLDKDFGGNRMTDWLVRSTSSTPRKLKRLSRSSTPAYPSPTSPLPPTPNPSFPDLPGDTPQLPSYGQDTNNVGDSTEDSIDSTEILSWRMPSMEQQVCKTSITSSTRTHAPSHPSRGFTRDRLGISPRLRIHVPLPSQFVGGPTRRSKSRLGIPSGVASQKTNSPLLTAPLPCRPSSSSRVPLPKLASASLVSLRSIATVTARSKGSVGETEEDNRIDLLDIDRFFTPEDDPFAADPPTPLTPITPVIPSSQTASSKEEKYQSFMRLGNDSSASCGPETPISAPASLPGWHYRLGTSSNVSSPMLTPSSSLRGATPVPRRSNGNAGPPSVLSKLAPSLVEPLSIRHRAPSAPLSPPSSRHALKRVISRVRKIQNSQGECQISTSAGQSGLDSAVVGHTESRPHSPFPMLAFRPGAKKSIPSASDDRRRSGTVPFVWNGAGHPDANRTPLCEAIDNVCGPSHGLEQKPTSSMDSLGSATVDCTLQILDRDMLSPTAWLLDSDVYEDNGIEHESNALAVGSNMLALHLNTDVEVDRQLDGGGGFGRPTATSLDAFASDARCTSPPRRVLDIESETETEGDTTHLCDSESWPLPPHRTVVVVDEDSGEGFHLVEPALEFVQAGSVTHSPRHSIRFPKRCSGSMSIDSRVSQLSGGSSRISQRLNSVQTRIIAERFSRPSLNSDGDSTHPSSLQGYKAVSSQQLKQRSRSATSLGSISAWSTRTSRTAFYSARSTVSRGSDKSTSSYAHSRRTGKLSREGSCRSASSRSPPSSADHHAKSSSSRQKLGKSTADTKSTVPVARSNAA